MSTLHTISLRYTASRRTKEDNNIANFEATYFFRLGDVLNSFLSACYSATLYSPQNGKCI